MTLSREDIIKLQLSTRELISMLRSTTSQFSMPRISIIRTLLLQLITLLTP